MKDCLFCKIISKEIPSYKIYEDEYTYAFLDIADDFIGHTLVIPKKHCKNILDCDNESLNKVFQTVKKISNHYIKSGFTGVNIINSNNESAEQTVNHFHIHIIPRKDSDNLKIFPLNSKQNCDFNQLADKLKLN